MAMVSVLEEPAISAMPLIHRFIHRTQNDLHVSNDNVQGIKLMNDRGLA